MPSKSVKTGVMWWFMGTMAERGQISVLEQIARMRVSVRWGGAEGKGRVVMRVEFDWMMAVVLVKVVLLTREI